MTAFLDTMILVWWIRKEASPGQDGMVDRAHWLMQELEVTKADIMISTISVAEFLRGSSSDERAKQQAILEETFICKPFDALAANILASHFQRVCTAREYETRKNALKADLQIVATALAHRADVLYSHDAGLRKLSDSCGLEARDLPLGPTILFDLNAPARKK